MSGETVSLLLRPQCLPAAHHAAVTSVLFLDDVELLRDCSPQSAVSQVSSFEGGAALPDNTTTTSSWLAALSQPGSTVHRPARSLVTGSRDATIRLWHVREEEEEGAGVRCCGVLEGHTEWVSDLCLLQDKRTLVSSSADSLIKLWDLQTGLCTQTLAKHTDYVERLSYSPHARLLASAGLSNQLFLWKLDANYPTPTECLSLPGHTGEQCHSLYALDMTPSGQLLATGGTDKVVRCWDTRSGSVWLQLLGHERLVRGVRLKDDGWQAVSVAADNCIKSWDLRKQRCVATCQIRDAILCHPAASSVRQLHDTSPASTQPSTYSLAVSDTFHKAYTGHSSGVVVCTDLGSGKSEPIVALPSAVTTVRLDQSRHQLWCASFDSALTCWDVRPSMTRHASFDAEYVEDEDDEQADDYSSLLHSPLLTIAGCPPLRRIKVTGDGWHVLAQDAHQSVQLWDVVGQRLVKEYGVVSFDELLQRKNALLSVSSQRPFVALPSWFTLDLRLGCLCVHLSRQTAFAARYVIAPPALPDELADQPADVSINLGESCFATAFAEWLGLERLAWSVQMGEIGEGADGIEETEEQADLFSPLTSPTAKIGRQQKSVDDRTAAPAVPVAVIVGATVSVIVSFPRAQRRTALYQSLPIPPLPVSLAPRLPSSSLSTASFEECLLELDRRRAIYYQVLPGWVETQVMKSEETRPQRPAEDLLPDPFVTVNEWGFGDEEVEQEGDEQEEADDGTDGEDGEESQLSHAHDSRSTSARHLRPIATIHIHHSPASRPRLSPSPQPRHSLSSQHSALHVERGNTQRRTPHSPSASPSSLSSYLTLQHPSIPRLGSHPHLLHYATNSNSPMQRASLSSLNQLSPLDAVAFDLNAPNYSPQASSAEADTQHPLSGRDSSAGAVPKTMFYLQPLGSIGHSPSHASSHTLTLPTAPPSPSSFVPGGLPAVFHGPLLVPSAMSALRIKQYLSKKLNNSPALTRGVEGEEVTERSLRFTLTDGTELADEQSMGDIAARANSDGSKERALRVWYRRQPLNHTGPHPDSTVPTGTSEREPSEVGTGSTTATIEESYAVSSEVAGLSNS